MPAGLRNQALPWAMVEALADVTKLRLAKTGMSMRLPRYSQIKPLMYSSLGLFHRAVGCSDLSLAQEGVRRIGVICAFFYWNTKSVGN